MRNKQAKALRQQARQSGAVQETTYIMGVYNKQYFDVLTGKLKGYKVVTASMDLCVRSVYQELKKSFKEGK
jgi:hypothetical protein